MRVLKVEMDLDKRPDGGCLFHQEYLDQTACGDGSGVCKLPIDRFGEVVSIEDLESGDTDPLICPVPGPRGGYTGIIPAVCPFRTAGQVLVAAKK